jgi:hypothetical protein
LVIAPQANSHRSDTWNPPAIPADSQDRLSAVNVSAANDRDPQAATHSAPDGLQTITSTGQTTLRIRSFRQSGPISWTPLVATALPLDEWCQFLLQSRQTTRAVLSSPGQTPRLENRHDSTLDDGTPTSLPPEVDQPNGDLADPAQPRPERGQRVLKSNRASRVLRITTAQGDWLVKHSPVQHNPIRRWTERCRSWLWGPRLWHEARQLQHLLGSGIAAPQALAYGVSHHNPQESWLVTEWLPGTCSLRQLLPPGPLALPRRLRVASRRRLAVRLGQLLAQLHAAGWEHRDLHSGNILVRRQDQDWLAWLIDVESVRRLPSLRTSAARMENCLRLAHSLSPWTSRADRLRCVISYWKTFVTLGGAQPADIATDWRSFVRQLSQQWPEFQAKTWALSDRAWSRGNSKQVRRQTGTRRSVGLSWCGADWVEQFHHHAEHWFAAGEPLSHAIHRCQTVCHGRSWTVWITRCLPAEAQQSWDMGHALRRRGVPAIVPWAWTDTGRGEAFVLWHAPSNALALSTLRQHLEADQHGHQRNALQQRHASLQQRMASIGRKPVATNEDDVWATPDGEWIGWQNLAALSSPRTALHRGSQP